MLDIIAIYIIRPWLLGKYQQKITVTSCRASPHAPDWFLKGVKFCYVWFNDDAYDEGNGQCGGGAEHGLCAHVGQYTPEYLDNTDSRSGGCLMSWSLSIPYTVLPSGYMMSNSASFIISRR